MRFMQIREMLQDAEKYSIIEAAVRDRGEKSGEKEVPVPAL